MKRSVLRTAVLGVFLAAGCHHPLDTLPGAAGPGETVLLRIPSYRGDLARLRVTVAGRPAHIVAARAGEIAILVPRLPADSVTIAVRDDKRTIATAGLRILRPRSTRLLLALDDSGARLVRATASGHAPTGQARTRRSRLSFDVVNRHNVVVYTGSIPHPSGERSERFLPLGSRGAGAVTADAPDRSILSIWIPAPDDSVRIDVYHAGPDLDLLSADGRARRQQLGRMVVAP